MPLDNRGKEKSMPFCLTAKELHTMAYLIEKDTCEPLCVMGYPVRTIEFYFYLKNSLRESAIEKQERLGRND